MNMDIDTLEVENKTLRERNESLQVELLHLQQDLKVAINAYRELLLKYDQLEARAQR